MKKLLTIFVLLIASLAQAQTIDNDARFLRKAEKIQLDKSSGRRDTSRWGIDTTNQYQWLRCYGCDSTDIYPPLTYRSINRGLGGGGSSIVYMDTVYLTTAKDTLIAKKNGVTWKLPLDQTGFYKVDGTVAGNRTVDAANHYVEFNDLDYIAFNAHNANTYFFVADNEVKFVTRGGAILDMAGSNLTLTSTDYIELQSATNIANYWHIPTEAGSIGQSITMTSTHGAEWTTPASGAVTLTGDVTGTGTGTIATTIGAGKVTLSMLANMATGSLYYRKTAGSGAPEVNSLATLKTDLGLTGTNSGDQDLSGLLVKASNLSDLTSVSTARTNLGLGTLATQSGTFSGTSSGTNTGDQTITLTSDVTGSGTGSFATTIAAGAVSLSKMANIATASLIYRKTAGTGSPEVQSLATLKTDLGLTGTNSGDQTITLTSDVTGSGSGSFATTIAAGAVSLAKMADVATATVFYRKTAGTGSPEVQSLATLKADLGLTGTNSGDITLSGETYISLSGQALTAAAVNLSGTHVTGTLAAGRFPALTGDVTTSAGSLATSIASSVNLPGNPTSTTQASSDNSTKIATTAFVQNIAAGVNPAVAVQAATTANVSGYTYNNGASGIGATLTQNSASAVTIDGYTLLLNDRVLFKNQTTGANNGVYAITTLGTGIIPAVFTRSSDYNQPSDINNTGAIPVINGTVNATTSWLLTSSVATVGTDALTYTQFSYAPSALITTSTSAGGDLTGTYPNPTVKSSVGLSGNPTTTTQSRGDNSTKIATTAYCDSIYKPRFYTATATATTVSETSGWVTYDMDCTSNVDTLKLATAVGSSILLVVRKKDSSVNKVVVKPAGSETINGQTSLWILFQNTSATLYSNGTNYYLR